MKELKERRDRERKERADKRKQVAANAEKYYNEYQAQEKAQIDNHRAAKTAGNFYVPAEPKVAFAIRTRG